MKAIATIPTPKSATSRRRTARVDASDAAEKMHSLGTLELSNKDAIPSDHSSSSDIQEGEKNLPERSRQVEVSRVKKCVPCTTQKNSVDGRTFEKGRIHKILGKTPGYIEYTEDEDDSGFRAKVEVDSRETSEHIFLNRQKSSEEQKRSGTIERLQQEIRSSIDEKIED